MIFPHFISRPIFLVAAFASVALYQPAMAKEDSKKDPVIAQVDDSVIHQSMLDYYLQEYENRRKQNPNIPGIKRIDALKEIVDIVALANEYEQLDLLDKDPQTNLYMHNIKAQALLRQRVIVSDAELKAAYEKKYTKAAVKSVNNMEYHTRHVLLKTEEEAEKILKQLKKDRSQFDKLAREHSEDKGSGSRGGDIGWFKTSSLVPPYSDTMVKLKAGELADKPVESQFGWHVIELMDKPRKAALPTFEEVSSELRNQLYQVKVQAYIEKLRDKTDIEISK